MAKVNWGIVGCGNIAHTFAKSIVHCSNAQLIGAASTSVQRAKEFATPYNIQGYESYQALIQCPNIDAIYIANTHDQHFKTIAQCLTHNKHVLSEKPITVNAKQLQNLTELAKQQNCFLMEGVWMRFLPAIVKLQQLLSEGVIGHVHSVNANFSLPGSFADTHRLMNPATAGGALLDLGIYPISIADVVFNKTPEHIKSFVHKSTTGVDERSTAIVDYGNGQFASLASALQQNGPTEACINGELGYIRIPQFVGAQTLELHINGQDPQYFEYNFNDDESFKFEITHVTQCILQKQTQSSALPLSTSLRVMNIMDTLRAQWQLKYSSNVESAELKIKNKNTQQGYTMTTTHKLKGLSKAILLATCSLSASVAVAASNEPEQLYPPITSEVLPELAAKGSYNVGVKTLDLVNPAQFDPATQGQKDRPLKVEVWYPAANTAKAPLSSYTDETRSGKEFTLQADAMRDVAINNKEHYPVIVLSHGYTGYRTIMYYLGEHLASHGYIVVAIDHTDSTNADVDFKNAPFSGFFSTLINRSRDQQFVINYFNEQNNFASKQVDKKSAGVIGYSMGGYGAVNTIGGCYAFNEQTTAMFTGMKDPVQIEKVQQLLNSCAGGQYQNPKIDPRIKAMVAFAPWGGQHAIFDAKAMQNIRVPSLYVAGDLDDISGFEGIKNLYNQTGSQDKYMLTYKNARHNIAPHPAPAIAQSSSELDIGHYYEPSWSMRTINETNKHFVLAMMDCHVKGITTQCEYLDLPQNGDQAVVDAKPLPQWRGFDNRFSTGMDWQQAKPHAK